MDTDDVNGWSKKGRLISNERKLEKKKKNNLDKGQRDAVKKLSERINVFITNADKAGAVAI